MSGVRARPLPRGGILLEDGPRRIALDPRSPVNADVVFVSHAHSDHIPPTTQAARVLATDETLELAALRGFRPSSRAAEARGLELVPTGHVLGSAGLLVDGVAYYTGDMAGRARGFMPGPREVRCGTLITESTYGRPEYSFPSYGSVVEAVHRFLAEAYNAGKPAILIGYSLGKAQVIQHMVRGWRPMLSFEGVEVYSRVYRRFGVDLPEPDAIVRRPEELLELRRPAVIVAPSTFRSRLASMAYRLGIPVGWFSGWALRFRVGGATGFALSDHADYGELLEFAASSGAEEALTLHGFSADLARSLRGIGIDARSLGTEPPLTDYFGAGEGEGEGEVR